MGVGRKVHAKIKGFEDIKEELEETGLAKEQIEEYYDLYEEYATDVKDVNKLNKKERKAEDEYLKEDEKIEKIQEKMKKMRQEAGPLARLKFSRVFFWSKQGRIYRNLKRRLRRAKIRRELAEHTLKELKAKSKGKERSLKQKQKELKKSEKSIKKIWEQSKQEMKLIRNLNSNKDKIEQIYDEKRQKDIQSSIEELQNEGELPENVEAKDLNKEIDETIRSGQQPENSVVDEVEEEVEHVEGKVINNEDIEDKEKEAKSDENEKVSPEIQEQSEAKEEKDDKTIAIEKLNKDKKQLEAEINKLKSKHINNKELVEYEQDLAKVEAELKKLESDKTEEQEVSLDDNQENTNEFKEELKKGIIFGKNTSIDRRTIEMMQKNENSKILRSMSAEEYMAYIGFVETKRRNNEEVKYSDFVEETKDDKYSIKDRYAKTALKSLEKMKSKNLTEDEIDRMDEADKFIYGKAEDYNQIKEQEGKELQEQKEMEIG